MGKKSTCQLVICALTGMHYQLRVGLRLTPMNKNIYPVIYKAILHPLSTESFS